MMKRISLAIAFILSAVSLNLFASADATAPEEMATVVERLHDAYGGQTLIELTSLYIETDRRLAWPGQGQTADFVEFIQDKAIKHFDLTAHLGSSETWVHQNGNVYHSRSVLSKAGLQVIDYNQRTYREPEEAAFFDVFGGSYRTLDTLLAHYIVTGAEDLELADPEFYRGEHQDIVQVRLSESGPLLSVFVSQKDGLIRRLRMDRETGDINFTFASHKQKDGLTYASENRAFLGKILVEYQTGIEIEANIDVNSVLRLETNLREDPARVDLSAMTIDQLHTDAYLVGQNDYTLFVKHNDGLIGISAYAGLKDRYDALIQHLDASLPLTHLIVTNHHGDQLEGVGDAKELGAILLVTTETGKALGVREDESLLFEFIQNGEKLGPLTLLNEPTSYAIENAFVLHRDSGILFQDGHYHGLLSHEATWIQPTAVELFDIVQAMDLNVSALVSGHARKAETWALFEAAISKRGAGEKCLSERSICTNE